MSTKYESADLILKLYDLRREAVMREARQWFAGFNPSGVEDITAAMAGEHSAYFRMVTSYWDMAAALVEQGAIDEQMFNETNGEHFFVFAKIEPHLEELRAMFGPQVLPNLERVVMRVPGAKERLAHMREMSRKMAERRKAVTGDE
jgi:hypothetical protein